MLVFSIQQQFYRQYRNALSTYKCFMYTDNNVNDKMFIKKTKYRSVT